MSEMTGLGPLETAVLRAVEESSGPSENWVRSRDVLTRLDREGFGPSYLYPVLVDLVVPWQRWLPLLIGQGNFGCRGNDPAADPDYTEVRLSPIGRLALTAEREGSGTIPLGLIEGTAYCGGRVPPLDPHRVLYAISRLLRSPRPLTDSDLMDIVGAPALPTGGTIDGDVAALLTGEAVEVVMSCRIERDVDQGRQVLDITGTPVGVNLDDMLGAIASRARFGDGDRGGSRLIADVQDRTSERTGVRLRVLLRPDADPDDAERWLRNVWPVSVAATWRFPVPVPRQLRALGSSIGAAPEHFRALRKLLPARPAAGHVVSEFAPIEVMWVDAHEDELIGRTADKAAAIVAAAGFRPWIHDPAAGTFAAAYWVDTVELWCVDGIVVRVEGG